MSATVDTNILLYAANADDESHHVARDLLERLAGGPDLLYLFWPTIMGFLRISTHPAIFTDPNTPSRPPTRSPSSCSGPMFARPRSRTGSGTSTAPQPMTKPAATTYPTRTSQR